MLNEDHSTVSASGTDTGAYQAAKEYAAMMAEVMNAFANDPSALSDFATHLVDAVQTKLGWSDADINPTTFEDMSDEQLLAHLSEFLGSGQINVSINGGAVEIPQLIFDISHMSEDELAESDIADPRVTAAKLRKAGVEAAKDKADRDHTREMEEMRELSQQEQMILSGQRISLGGKTASALDWANALRRIQKNWDKSFDEMVAQGLAKPEDKEKKQEEIRRLYELMIRTDISESEKQKLIQQGINNGEYSKDTVAYTTREVEKGQSKNAVADVGVKNEDAALNNVTFKDLPNSKLATVSTDTGVTKPVAEQSAESSGFPTADALEVRNNFATAAANTNTPVAAPAPVVVTAVSVNNKIDSLAMI